MKVVTSRVRLDHDFTKQLEGTTLSASLGNDYDELFNI